MSFKFTTFLKLLAKLKPFNILTKCNEKSPLDVFSNSSAASGVVVFAQRSRHATIYQMSNLFEGSLTIGRSIRSRLESFSNCLINSSNELTLLEQRTESQNRLSLVFALMILFCLCLCLLLLLLGVTQVFQINMF